MKRFKKFLILLIIIPLIFQGFLLSAHAENEDIVTRENWNADVELSKDAIQKYSLIDKVYISGITTQDREVRIDTKNWVKGLYYFFSTKTKLKDLPFNYLVTWDGVIYEGKKNELDLVAPIQNESAILVGYLSNYDTPEMTRIGKDAMVKLLGILATENNIKADDVQVKDWQMKPSDDLQKTYIKVSDPKKSEPMVTSITEVKARVSFTSKIDNRNYKAEITKVDVAEIVKFGQNYPVKITVKNTGETNWYKDSDAEITAYKKDGTTSSYKINGEWLSGTQTTAMKTEIVKPNEETILEFNIATPFTMSSEYQEEFELKSVGGKSVENSTFIIKVNVSLDGQRIAEVATTPTGFLNIRKDPKIDGELITQAVPGDKFLILEEKSGWVKLKLTTGEDGWAVKQYLKFL